MINTQLINQLHQELVKLHASKHSLEAKYGPGFGLHKTKLGSAQEDKDCYNQLQRNINTFDSMLCYYGYATWGPEHKLVKELA